MKIKAVIWQEDGVWCGFVPALLGCHTWGDNYEHLLEMLQDAIQGWLEVNTSRLRGKGKEKTFNPNPVPFTPNPIPS
ncbi:type II toxin-antitoxin system HicB family antitoxin [Nostoc sp.]|uniref:type II toxin-antitoxin system HicB family antitoxin n=1 Tax=Nostoc sp. TaxID=1180 RepID=UPI002FFB7F84